MVLVDTKVHTGSTESNVPPLFPDLEDWSFDEVSLSDVELGELGVRTQYEITQANHENQETKPPTQCRILTPQGQTPDFCTASRPQANETTSVADQRSNLGYDTISSSPRPAARVDNADLSEVDDLDDQDSMAVEASLQDSAPIASRVAKHSTASTLVPVTKPYLPTPSPAGRATARSCAPKQTAITIYEDVDDYDEDDDQILASLLPQYPSSSVPPSRPSSPVKLSTPLRRSRIVDSSPIELTDLTDADDFLSAATMPSAACSQPYRPLTLSGRQAASNPYHWSITAPIVRPPFPKSVNDRSHILGVSSSTLLRTCFRLGEAMNVGCNAVRHGQSVVIELYARVASSYREVEGTRQTGKQFFMLRDVFHEHPPYLQAVFEGWKGVQLFDDDAAAFLGCGREDEEGGLDVDVDADAGVGKLCRAVGRMSREGKSWVFVMSSVWEAGWEDLQAVQAIVCA